MLLLLGGCSETTLVTVENRSEVLLQAVTVAGSGFTQRIGDLPPGATATTHVSPSGESGLSMSFRVEGKEVAFPPSGYFEGGGRYAVNVTVTPELRASVVSELQQY
ncbi:hypothetical protein [Lysobacter sp. A286]